MIFFLTESLILRFHVDLFYLLDKTWSFFMVIEEGSFKV